MRWLLALIYALLILCLVLVYGGSQAKRGGPPGYRSVAAAR